MPIADRLLLVYYGPFLAGRRTSVAYALNRRAPMLIEETAAVDAADGRHEVR